eukprot:34761-Eustigmatos_ZCMA.PRE.1
MYVQRSVVEALYDELRSVDEQLQRLKAELKNSHSFRAVSAYTPSTITLRRSFLVQCACEVIGACGVCCAARWTPSRQSN